MTHSLLAVAIFLAGSQAGSPGFCGRASPRQNTLPVLADLASTDLHFVADDWSGSGNWTSRDANAWVGVLGTTLTRQLSSQFVGRYEIDETAGTASRFIVANNSSSVVDGNQTLEIILRGSAADDAWYIETSDNYAVSAGAMRVQLDAATGRVYVGVMNAAGTALWTANDTTNLHGKNAIIHVVTDNDAGKGRLFVNGVQSGADVSFSGVVSGAQNYRFLIGASQGNKGGFVTEVLRHRSALSAAVIATRAISFNALRGY